MKKYTLKDLEKKIGLTLQEFIMFLICMGMIALIFSEGKP